MLAPTAKAMVTVPILLCSFLLLIVPPSTVVVMAQSKDQVRSLLESHRVIMEENRRSRLLKRDMESSMLPSSSSPQVIKTTLGIRVLPSGSRIDLGKWPRDYPIPSNVVTVHLPEQSYADILQQQSRQPAITVDIHLWKRPKEDGMVLDDGTLITGLDVSQFYEINVGEDAAGDYVVSVMAIHGGIAVASGVESFTIRAREPEDPLGWDDQEASPCMDLPAVDDSALQSPPVNIPPSLCSAFRMNGSAVIGRDYYDSR